MAFPLLILYGVAFIALLIASVTDIKTREVPDTLNYGLIGTGLGLNLLLSFIYDDFSLIAESLVGFFLFMALSFGMYYTGQWGGGDSKLLMGLGALFGVRFSVETFMLSFLIALLLVGAVYGIAWSLYLGIKNHGRVISEFSRFIRRKSVRTYSLPLIFTIVLALVAVPFVDGNLKLLLLVLPISVLILAPLWIFIKSVENSCMLKLVEPEQLTEGDWIAREIRIGGKLISGPRDLGIEKKKIRELIRLKRNCKISKVLIKEGIPFVPSFFLAFIAALLFQNSIVILVKTFI